jgi:hypothetical protein
LISYQAETPSFLGEFPQPVRRPGEDDDRQGADLSSD